ncbi:MAG: tetratricopeptide repeat protein [Gammaproteobacteria bacterium]|nr:tetratricopeptide repeat protein [Gammaproteobacteria bacterium]MCW8910745.1 tetratricopeptide repeat protein [Gammaproteobacteria bacterium]
MNKEVFVFEVNQKSFDQYVLLNSHKIPVIVEFMGVWSGPCAAMDILFTGLAKEFAEQFIFAKVDIDEQPELGKEHKIENVPTIMVFKDGKHACTEVGELKEPEARELLKDFGIFHESDLMREQAREKHLAGDTSGAIVQLTEAIKSDPSNTRVAMDMVQIFIDIGELEQADTLFLRLPETTRETEMGKALNGQLAFARLAAKVDDIESLQSRLTANPDDYDAQFDLSLRQIADYQYNKAIDNLLHILKKSPDYKNGAAKEMLITVANMIAPVNNELAQDIRRKLANLLTE